MKLLPEYLFESFQKHKENPAISCNNEIYTYQELALKVALFQKEFKDLELSSEPFVGIVTGQDINTYAAIIAMVLSGIPYVPVNRNNPFNRILDVIQESQISTMLFANLPGSIGSNKKKLSTSLRLISLNEFSTASENELTISKIHAEKYAYMLYTSGSTGKPKGVLVRHKNLAHVITLYFDKNYYILSPKDRFLQMFDWTFDLAGMMTFLPLSLGSCCYVVPEKGIKYYNIINTLIEKEITVSMLVPSTLLYIKRYIEELNLPHIRYSMFCGEPLMHDLMIHWANCLSDKAIIQNVYGPSECPGASSIYNWNKEESNQQSVNGVVPIGKPVPGIKFIIIDENHTEVKPMEKGTIALCGEQVTDGYWNDEDRTSKAYIRLSTGDLVYDTGDIGYQNENGNYIFLGRKDNQLKLDGYRVEPGEVEHLVRAFVGPETRVAFVASKNGKNILVPYLFVENTSFSSDDLLDYLESNLPPYMLPHQIRKLDNFPHNHNGKLDRKYLQNLLTEKTH